MEEKDKCADHAETGGEGYSPTEKGCTLCLVEFPEYAKNCMKITEERGNHVEEEKVEQAVAEVVVKKPKKEASSYLPAESGHKFVKGSARGTVFEMTGAGKTKEEITQHLVDTFGMTPKNATRKIWAVTKLLEKK